MMDHLIPARAAISGEDLIFALNAEASARKASGEAILNATVGMLLNDDGSLALIQTVPEVLRSLAPEAVAPYPPIAGPPDFRRAVIEDLFGAREAASMAVAVATPGGLGALRHSIANFLEPQQTLLTTSPYWGPYRGIADELDRNLTTFKLIGDNGRFEAQDLEGKLHAVLETQGRALVFLNSPCHNPTGYSFDAEELRQIALVIERATKRGPVTVLLDIAYAHYAPEDLNTAIDSLLCLVGKAMVLFAWSASKSFTQYGLRVGALVAVHPDPAVRRAVEGALAFSSKGTWSCCNAAGMAAIARVILEPELRGRVEKERAELMRMLGRRISLWNEEASRAGLRYPRLRGGFFSTVLCERAPEVAARLRADGIFVVPLAGGLRVALCSVAERDIPALAAGIARRLREDDAGNVGDVGGVRGVRDVRDTEDSKDAEDEGARVSDGASAGRSLLSSAP
jgi:aromatic-amino-acid transaminase